MSTRRTTTVTEEDAAEEAEIIDVTDDAEEAEEAQLDALDGMIAEFTGAADTVVNVYRQGEGRSLSFLFRTNPDEMSGGEIMEKCRDNYGTGDYRVHIRSGARLVKNAPFSVEAKKEPDPATLQAAQGMGVVELMAMMQENNKQTMQMFSEAMKAIASGNQNAPTFDPIAAQTAMIQSVATLKGLAEPKDDSKNAVSMLIQGLTLAKELGPKDGETNSSDILLEGIRQFAPALVQGAQALKGNAPGNGATLLGQDPQANADAEKEREMGLRQMMFKGQLAFLVKQAAAGKNAELYGEVLLDQMGEAVVLDFIAQPDALEKLIALDPNVAQFRPWFEALKAGILSLTGQAGDTGMEGAIIIPTPTQPETVTDAISDAANAGDITGDPARGGGDTPNA